MSIVLWVAAVGLAIGAGMGLYAMINPQWASHLVRLRDDPDRPGGRAEFRGTYGGLFFFTHAMPLALLVMVQRDASLETPQPLAIVVLSGMLAVCAAAWWGTAFGRVISIVTDRSGLPFNGASVGFEFVLGALIAAPLFSILFASAG